MDYLPLEMLSYLATKEPYMRSKNMSDMKRAVIDELKQSMHVYTSKFCTLIKIKQEDGTVVSWYYNWKGTPLRPAQLIYKLPKYIR